MAHHFNINMYEVLLLMILFWIGNKTVEGCVEGWELNNGKCYLFSMKYYGWEDAKKYCEYLGANLVKIDDDEEHKYIKSRVSAMELHYAWIGAKYSRVRRKHLWTDGSEITFNGWAPGEPGDRKGCVDYLHKYDYLWNSHCDCKYTRGPFICEKDCGGGWQMKDNKCIILPATSCSLTEAKTFCEDHGAVLTTVDKQETEGSNVAFVCEKECDIGWEKFGNKCYLHTDKERSWEDAKRYCEEVDASLVKVEGEEEHKYIQQKVSDARHVYVWIGAKYDPEHGEHRWIDGSPMNYSSWAPGLPGSIQGCVDYLHKYNYNWNTHSDCKYTLGPFICQKAPKGHDESIFDKEDTAPTRIAGPEPTLKPTDSAVNLDDVFEGSDFCGEDTQTEESRLTPSYVPKSTADEIAVSRPKVDITDQPIVNIPTMEDGLRITIATEKTDIKIGRIVSGPDKPSYVCYPNNTIIVRGLPENSYYLAMQNISSSTNIKCTVSRLNTTSIEITGCLKDDPILFTYGSYAGIETYEVHVGQSVYIRCYEISEDGVSVVINNTFAVNLQIDSETMVDPSYNVTSSLNTTSTNVGEPVAWTITFPVDYILEVTSCTAEPDTTDNTNLLVQLISEGGCMVDSELISNFEDNLDGTAVATLMSFKFFNYDSILLKCDVIICPGASNACNTTCSRQKRDIPDRSYRQADDSFSTVVQSRLHVIDHKSSGTMPAPQTVAVMMFQLLAVLLIK
ncbi:uncharacterized protein LOC128550063 [Mercenaria mercenaria]|uniref:uncharacterized protein LOC128550063 n=1 Tax=Mercenaria mercenaria TaxID=6596 RepID=UPI00234E5E11|nr:uncharacterized protein LOC128550063 [Mercenaria mercenaria]